MNKIILRARILRELYQNYHFDFMTEYKMFAIDIIVHVKLICKGKSVKVQRFYHLNPNNSIHFKSESCWLLLKLLTNAQRNYKIHLSMSICMCMQNILHLGQWREQPLTYSYFPFSPQSSVRWNVDKKVLAKNKLKWFCPCPGGHKNT